MNREHGGKGVPNNELKDHFKGCYETLTFTSKIMILEDLVVGYHQPTVTFNSKITLSATLDDT
jgi:hypothetical protein